MSLMNGKYTVLTTFHEVGTASKKVLKTPVVMLLLRDHLYTQFISTGQKCWQ